MEKPVVHKRRSLSPVWFLPLLALGLGCWLLYTSYRDAGITISVHFPDAVGITTGKTRVIYRGVPVGTVKQILVDEDLGGVKLVVDMTKESKQGLKEDTKFWIVKPEISAGRISGLDTILTGSYIAVEPGVSEIYATSFEGLTMAPPASADAPGLRITLIADTLYSLQRGSNIYMKNLRIGQVMSFQLSDNGKIHLQAYIEPEFSQLIRNGTRFWNASGLSISGDLQRGYSINMASLASLVYGGIICSTPATLADTPPAEQQASFPLYSDFAAAEYGIEASLLVADGSAMVPGKTRVMFRGIKVGVVKKLEVNDDPLYTVTATLQLDPIVEDLLREETKFYIQQPEVGITGVKHLEAILTGPYITLEPGEGAPRRDFVAEIGTNPKPSLRTGSHYRLKAEEKGSLNAGDPVLFKGVAVGEITTVSLSPTDDEILMDIMIFNDYRHLVKPATVFWNTSGVQIDASLSQFNVNLGSLQSALAGGIAFTTPVMDQQSAKTAPQHTLFTLYNSYTEAEQAVPALHPKGLRIRLTAKTMPPLKPGASIYYNNIVVGKVLDFRLGKNSRDVELLALIHQQYQDLVTTTSRFYNRSGISVNAGLDGISLQTGPLEAILAGGIGFFTLEKGTAVNEGHTFSLYRKFTDAQQASSVKLQLRLSSTKGLRENSPLRYQGIDVGRIGQLALRGDGAGVTATAFVDNEAAHLFREHSLIWIMSPEIGLEGVKNPETFIRGSYLVVQPGEGRYRTSFTVLDEPPDNLVTDSLNIVLEAATRGSIKPGSPLYYRQVQVGKVTGYTLSPSAQKVWIKVNISPEYRHLVRSTTLFWKASGLSVTGGILSGIDVRTESMQALLTGGIAMATPDDGEPGMPAMDGDHFPLARAPVTGWEDWAPHLSDDLAKRPGGVNGSSGKDSPTDTMSQP
ncbi:MAG: hypothetical protein CSA34_07635 [Desulfobulbus propionicus]|nr:MAG: hypothetical protein CSA34_07635 [Desulfobulbus propionicus]